MGIEGAFLKGYWLLVIELALAFLVKGRESRVKSRQFLAKEGRREGENA